MCQAENCSCYSWRLSVVHSVLVAFFSSGAAYLLFIGTYELGYFSTLPFSLAEVQMGTDDFFVTATILLPKFIKWLLAYFIFALFFRPLAEEYVEETEEAEISFGQRVWRNKWVYLSGILCFFGTTMFLAFDVYIPNATWTFFIGVWLSVSNIFIFPLLSSWNRQVWLSVCFIPCVLIFAYCYGFDNSTADINGSKKIVVINDEGRIQNYILIRSFNKRTIVKGKDGFFIVKSDDIKKIKNTIK